MLIIVLAAPSAFAIDSKGAAYFGGTVTASQQRKRTYQAKLDTTRQDQLTFKSTDKKFAEITFSIPYSKVVDLGLTNDLKCLKMAWGNRWGNKWQVVGHD